MSRSSRSTTPPRPVPSEANLWLTERAEAVRGFALRFRRPHVVDNGSAPAAGFEAFGHGLGTIQRGIREPTPVYTNRLPCAKCGRGSREGERGWTAR